MRDAEDGGTTLYRNVGNYFPVYTASVIRRLESLLSVCFIETAVIVKNVELYISVNRQSVIFCTLTLSLTISLLQGFVSRMTTVL
jgi:hypothetical protein